MSIPVNRTFEFFANFLAVYFDHRWPKDLMNLDLIIYIDMPPGVGNIHTKFGPHPQAGLGVHSRQTDRQTDTNKHEHRLG